MKDYILTGCDLHDDSMTLQIAYNDSEPNLRTFSTNLESRQKMIAYLKSQAKKAGGAEILFAYEASSSGFGLYDTLCDAGIQCFVLAPSKMDKSSKSKKNKTDAKDALRVLKALRAYALAGNDLPEIWVPDPEIRDEREMVRGRLDIGGKITRVKTQIRTLLKRNDVSKPEGLGSNWSGPHLYWLNSLASPISILGPGSCAALGSLLRQLEALKLEQKRLDSGIAELARTHKYGEMVAGLCAYTGVGELTAMVFLTEMGNPSRFKNRRKIAAYFGLVPSCDESGQKDDRKGHITHQGSPRVRRILCQAQWARVSHDPLERDRHQALKKRNPKKQKIALVAGMRRLTILLWHTALFIQQRRLSMLPPLPSPQRGQAPAGVASIG